MKKWQLRNVGRAALAGFTDAQLASDPAGAMELAMAAMRATSAAAEKLKTGAK